MRQRVLIPLVLLWALAAASPTLAAVPVGDDGSLRPTDGAELLEAVDQAKASTLGRPVPTRIVLAEGDYEIDRAIVLDDADGDTIEGSGAGGTRIVGTNATTTLLRITGEGTSVTDVSLVPAGSGSAAFPVASVSDGAAFNNFLVFVPSSLPNVTAVETSGSGAIITNPEIESEASRPAIRNSGNVEIRGGSLYGGNPTLDLGGATTPAGSVIDHVVISGGETTTSVVRTQAANAAVAVTFTNVTVNGGAEDATLIDVQGASNPGGSVDLDLSFSTLSGAPDSTAVQLASGAATSATTARFVGLLALGSGTTIGCATSGTPASATIEGIYRNGSLASGSACAISESGRRSGGDPALTTAYGLRWGSPAIDAVAPPVNALFDARRGMRTSTGPGTPESTPTDLGAIEYQYLAPWLDEIVVDDDNEDGLVQFSVAAGDENDGESDLLTITWRFPDGTTASGATASHQFTTADVGDVTVSATDPSGLTTTALVASAVDLGPADPKDDEDPGEPTPTPSPSLQTLPETIDRPRPTPEKQLPFTAPSTGALKALTRTQSRARRSSGRASGLGPARPGEASLQLKLDRAANITVIVRRSEGTRFLAVPNARFSKDTGAGTTIVHLSARVGTATLRIGLYRVTILVRPSAGPAERRDLFIRVIR